MVSNINKTAVVIILGAFFFSGCKVKINQTINHYREGKWVVIDTLDNALYITKGKYRKGNEIGTWTYVNDNKIERKEKHKKNTSLIKYYHPNGKLMKKGYAKTEYSEKEVHWFYEGVWYFYDKKGKLMYKEIFHEGKLIDSLSI